MLSFVSFLEAVSWVRVILYLILSTLVLGSFSTWLKVRFQLPVGYTRKINHIGIMLFAGLFLGYLPEPQLIPSIIFAGVGLILIFGIAAGVPTSGFHRIVEGSLRCENDGKERFHFFFPFTLFIIALILVALYMPLDYVRIAFFTVAISDGIAEPVGLMFGGSNKYTVPDIFWGGEISRSIAGSIGVFISSFLLVQLVVPSPLLWNFQVATSYSIIITLLEGTSPKGFDNALIMAVGPLLLCGLDLVGNLP